MNSSHLNPSSSLKSRFTTRFLRALTRINARKPISPSSPREIFQRYRRIKVAADKSMASSVRSRRTWSRATLWKLRSRSCLQLASLGRRRSVKTSTITSRQAIMKKTSHEIENKTTTEEDHQDRFVGQADKLRELVPGGEAMDLCNLLDETAHYIKCLTTQVQLMRKIVDFYSL
ncbi:transcription factor IBH1-like [Durio zibethinus]|uniref:Transcription factor IBH1-like n=1 Tax=Durio zibethinus TaxID=66656 RepID=A0A6P5XHZ0_DURZI|nr:transcription factor IBH1-like [Durio zibethinus]